MKEDGCIDSKAVFDPDKFNQLYEISKWQFSMGVRGCIGEPLSMETLTWDALCMAYLLKKFPGMRIAGQPKSNLNIFVGKEFKVRDFNNLVS